jgi:hypothetical protein
MTNRSHIAACFTPDHRVRGAGTGNAATVDRKSPANAAVFGGRATT